MTLIQNKCKQRSRLCVLLSHWWALPLRTWSSGWSSVLWVGEACHREVGSVTWAIFVLTCYHPASLPAAVTPLIISPFLSKKTTKSWLIISNSVRPIMIQWIIYFSKLNHSRSHFLPCRQKPLCFTHGSQLVFIEAFRIYLNTERLKEELLYLS